MNLEYLNYIKRSRILINIDTKNLKEPSIIKMLSSYVGGLIVNEEDIKNYKEEELISLTKLTYTPIFIKKSRSLYRLDHSIAKALNLKNIHLYLKTLDKLKPCGSIIYSPLILQLFKHKDLQSPVFLNVKNPLIFDEYFKTTEFIKECSGFVLDYDVVKKDVSIIDKLKNYF